MIHMAWYIIESLEFKIKRNQFYTYLQSRLGLRSVCVGQGHMIQPPPFSLGIFKRGKDCDCNAFREPTRHTNTVLHE